MKVAIRVDASLDIGSGHVMRCLTLANALRGKGVHVQFLSREHRGNLSDFISKQGLSVVRFPLQSVDRESGRPESRQSSHSDWLGTGWETDATLTRHAIEDWGGVDWIIVDHYAIDAQWEASLRQVAHRLMAIDDLADRPHSCDAVLDQNYHAHFERRYDNLVPETCAKFLGPAYALLRPEFELARATLRTRFGRVRRILVSFGGVDGTGETTKTIRAILSLDRPDIEIDVVVGRANQAGGDIEKLCAGHPNFQVHCGPPHLAELIAAADLGIGAGGVSMLERCYLALPSIVISVANNQEASAIDLAAVGAHRYIGRGPEVTVEQIRAAILDMDSGASLRSMSVKAASVFGSQGHRGVRMVAEFLVGGDASASAF